MKKWLLLLFLPVMLMFCTSQQNNNLDNEINIINDFSADPGSFEILNRYQGKNNVLKVDGSRTQWAIVRYSLEQFKGKEITIEFSVDVRREGEAGLLQWAVNNMPDYPSVIFLRGAAKDKWHNMKGRIIITPSNSEPYLYLSNYENNSQNTIFYIANPVLTITEGNVQSPDFSLKPLKEIYANDFLIGNIINLAGKYLSGKNFDLLKHHYNVVTSTLTYPEQLAPLNRGGSYRWAEADNAINFFIRNNIPVIGHVLVWHEQTPSWMTEGSRDEVIKNMNDHITAVVRHFRGRINVWDVVNEAIRDNLTGVQVRGDWRSCVRNSNNPWFDKLGSDYIELAFRAARAADPNITLYYNDYGLEDPNKAEAVRKMIQDINDRYKRETGDSRNLIEGIGSQAHIFNLNINLNHVRTALEKLISLGIEVAITEMDISMIGYFSDSEWNTDTPMSERDAITQALLYARLMQLYKEYSSHIVRVSFWGMEDGTSWLSRGNPALFDWKLNAKQAFYAVSDPDGFLARYGNRNRR